MAGKISAPIAVSVQGLTKSMAQLNTLNKGIGQIIKTAGLAAAGLAAFATGVAASDFAVKAVAGARDLERNMAGLNTVFESVTPQMENFSKRAVEMGLSLNEASKSSVFIGSVLKQSGFDIQQTADLTERLVGLATDLSITYGYDVQEALLGMTALFRGEYDPIEKFGVAMKQSEINAELAARGLNHLEGAQRRFAEQQIRVELLFQRSADAQGAFQRQTGTLATEQLKLAATFANVKDTVATSLLPVIATLFEELRGVMQDIQPRLVESFENLAPVLERIATDIVPLLIDGFNFVVDVIDEIVSLIGDLINPLTESGESMAALGIQFSSLFETITGNKLTVEEVFNIINGAVGFLADLLHDVIYVLENTIIGFKVLGEAAEAFFTGNWSKLFNTDWAGMIKGQIAVKDAFNAQMLEVAKLNAELDKTKEKIINLDPAKGGWSLEGLPQELRNSILGVTKALSGGDGGDGDGGAGVAAKNYVKEYFDGIAEEVEKQNARVALEQMGASAALIESIISATAWEDIFNLIVEGGVPKLQELQAQFNLTKEGIEELAKIGSGESVTAIGKLFDEIGNEVAKQQARLQLEAMGASEGLIGAILGSAEWPTIVADIVSGGEAQLIALQELFNQTAAGLEEVQALAEEAAALSRDYAAEFLDGLSAEIEKEAARRKLAGMGATEGLIAAILGTEEWEKLYQDIIQGGIDQLDELQRAFNRTADGIAEVDRAIEEARRAQEDLERQAKATADALLQQQKELEELRERLREFRDSLSGLTIAGTLDTFVKEVGRFESAIVGAFENIQSKLEAALDNELLFEASYRQLVEYAQREQQALQAIARQRDELAKKADFVENLLRDYRNAFTAALNLTGIISGLEDKTREITITEVTEGTASVGSALRDLQFTLTRSYTETITETINKSDALVDKFRDMAEKSRVFAQNLETLRKLGLDPQLFSQLVQAGVEAGGETAQALVDGGSETIKEINTLFNEIGATGVDVAETVAEDFYLIGENFGSELLDGIRAQQMEFEDTARQMAKAFEENFQIDLGKATEQVSQVAKWQQEIENLGKKVDFATGRMREEEDKLATGRLGPNAREWANRKILSYQSQIDDFNAQIASLRAMINNTKVTPFAKGGIALGQVLATVGESGPEVVMPLDRLDQIMNRTESKSGGNTYNIYVQADTRVGGAKAGEAIVQQLKQYEFKNGPIGTVLTVS